MARRSRSGGQPRLQICLLHKLRKRLAAHSACAGSRRQGGNQITKGDFDVTGFAIPKKGRPAAIHGQSPPTRPSSRSSAFRSGGGEPEEVSPRRSTPGPLSAASDDGRSLAFHLIFRDGPAGAVHTVGRRGDVTYEHSPSVLLRDRESRGSSGSSFTNERDGAAIHGKMILPHNFDSSKRYPVVLTCVYAGQGKERLRTVPAAGHLYGERDGLHTGWHRPEGPASVYGRDFFFGYHKKLGIIDAEECVSCAEVPAGTVVH